VEVASQLPHGHEEFNSQKNNKEGAGKIDGTSTQAGHGKDDTEGAARIGDKVHDGNRVQLHSQDLHGDFAEFFRLNIHLLTLPLIGLINFQSCHTLKVLQERITHGVVAVEIFGKEFFRPGLNGHDDNWDHPDSQEQHSGGEPVHRKANDKHQSQRCNHGIEKLRDIGAKIGLQLVNALHRHLDDLRGFDLLLIGRAEAQKFFIDLCAERLLDRLTGQKAHPGGGFAADVADNQNDDGDDEGNPNVHRPCISLEQFHEHIRDKVHHHNVSRQGEPLEQYIQVDILDVAADHVQQTLIDHYDATFP